MDLSEFTISEAEYRQRWAKFQQKMEESDLDLLLVYGDDRAFFGNAHVRYLSNYAVHFEPAVIIMGRRGEPAMVTGPENKAYAQLESHIKEVHSVREFALPGFEYPFADLTSFENVVRKIIGHARPKKIGIVGWNEIPHQMFETLKRLYSACEFVNANRISIEVRMVKSPAEIKIIRRAYEIADAGLQACISAVREGAAEYEVALAGEYAMRKMAPRSPPLTCTSAREGIRRRSWSARRTKRSARRNLWEYRLDRASRDITARWAGPSMSARTCRSSWNRPSR